MNGIKASRERGTIWALRLWAGLHAALCVLVLENGSAAASVLALTAYALCVFRLDWLLHADGSRIHIKFLCAYWLLACVCMLPWLFLVEPLLAGSSNDIFWPSLLNVVIPYALNLSGAWGNWTSRVLGHGAGQPQQWLLLLFCAGHAAYYLRLSGRFRKKGEMPHGPVDPGAGTVE